MSLLKRFDQNRWTFSQPSLELLHSGNIFDDLLDLLFPCLIGWENTFGIPSELFIYFASQGNSRRHTSFIP